MELEDIFDEEFQSPEAQLALELAREDQQLIINLICLRRDRHISQEQLADTMGISQATVSAFERLGNDPRLSTVRRYARALGVMIRHEVDPDPSRHADSQYLAHVSEQGVRTQPTAAAIRRGLRQAQADQALASWSSQDAQATVQQTMKAVATR